VNTASAHNGFVDRRVAAHEYLQRPSLVAGTPPPTGPSRTATPRARAAATSSRLTAGLRTDR
jgi:hypothetical protein